MIVVGGNNWTAALGASAVTSEGNFKSLDTVERKDPLACADVCYENNSNIIHPMFQKKAYRRESGTLQ
jgi:hypothetical protein